MKTILYPLSAILLIATGCSTSYLTKGDLRAYNSRFIWSTEGFEAEFNTNGTGRVKIQKSNPDAQTAGAITEAAVSAAVKSAKQ